MAALSSLALSLNQLVGGFRFHDTGPLSDGELELVPPTHDRVESFLRACRHPQCAGLAEARVSRLGVEAFLAAAPMGHQRAERHNRRPPTYHFWMRLHPRLRRTPDGHEALLAPPVPIAGTLDLRIGDTRDLRRYVGHVGYFVFPPARGRHLAERSVRLLLPLARRHGLRELWITANPDNLPSRRTCERLGARYVETVEVPERHPLRARGETHKCRYVIDLVGGQ